MQRLRELDWTLLLKVAQQILDQARDDARRRGAGRASCRSIGNALDAGANVVGAFNDEGHHAVQRRSSSRSRTQRRTRTATATATPMPCDAREARRTTFIFDNLGPAIGGGRAARHERRRRHGDEGRRRRDGALRHRLAAPCGDGVSLTTDPATSASRSSSVRRIDGDVPFDIGLKGVPAEAHGRHPRQRLLEPARRHRPVSFSSTARTSSRTASRGFDDDGPRTATSTPTAATTTSTSNDCYTRGQVPPGRRHRLQRVEQLRSGGRPRRARHVARRSTSTDRRAAGSRRSRSTSSAATTSALDDVRGRDLERRRTTTSSSPATLPTRRTTGGALRAAAQGHRLDGRRGARRATTRRQGCRITWPATATTRTTTAASRARSRSSRSTSSDSDDTLDPNGDCDTHVLRRRGEEPDRAVPLRVARLQVGRRATVTLRPTSSSGNFGFTPKLGRSRQHRRAPANGAERRPERRLPERARQVPPLLGLHDHARPADRLRRRRRHDLAVSFDGLALDAGKFISEFLGPMIKQVKDVTNPLMPVVEMIQGEVPIISDLSKLIGQGPVTVLDLLEAISGNDLSLMRSILQMIKFVNSLPADANLMIPLGGYGCPERSAVNTEPRHRSSAPMPEEADKGITTRSPRGRTSSTSSATGGAAHTPSAKAAPAAVRPRRDVRRLRSHLPVLRRRRADLRRPDGQGRDARSTTTPARSARVRASASASRRS